MNVECLILACRDIATGEIAVRTVLDTEGCNAKSVSCWPLDLASFASVQSFAAKFAAEGLSLHILVCNAGVMSFKYSETCDGWEKM
jgi:NAD(P)-dependent dehydrogenase (short-subunit alcohol dehydrogenase family)